MSEAEIRPGTRFAGCAVERLLGRGGMGAVYLATPPGGGPQVVLKFLAPEMASDPELRERFLREGRAQLKVPPHPNLVGIHGVHEEAGLAYLVMEYARGPTLLELLRERGGRVPPLEAVRLARDVARGLSAIHAQGLVHRDIKPENVVIALDAGATAKILDFGLAKDVFLSGLTAPGQLLGTSYYMAPEQWDEDQEPTSRSDLFALGATLYHLLVGRPPFVGEDFAETADLIEDGDYPRPRELVPEVSEDLELIVAQLLMAEPGFRYALAEECAADLERVLGGQPAQLPALLVQEVSGSIPARRVALVPGARWTLGREAGCDVVLEHPTVSRKHAELRRDEEGFRLCDLKSSYGTFLGDERLEQPKLLRDGDLLRLGDVALRFQDPRGRAPAFALDVRREATPRAALELLVRRRDPRVVLSALERLAPDPWATERAEAALARLLGPEVAQDVRKRVEAEAERSRQGLPAFLSAVTGADAGAGPGGWLAWWARSRAGLPPQVVAEAPARGLRLEVLSGAASPSSLSLGGVGVVLIGRDEKCHLRLASREVARLQATLLRLHRRFVVWDGNASTRTTIEGRPVTADFVHPGEVVTVGDVRLTLRAEPGESELPVAGGWSVVDPETFAALEGLGHASVVTALVALQREAEAPTWTRAAAEALSPEEPDVAAELTQQLDAFLRHRAQRGRPLLTRLLGGEPADPSGWEALLEPRRATLPPQVAPAGWLTATLRA